ncbi:putative UDP-N-acetylglucosamine--peptide N-acetylglucosaminyltransferase SEC [Hordeum vulgare]|nr:putative UDP-N-acetylglucosamine--peptide N-acetylglucosaminyltransferase SEC [Hordeum vulgare]
MSEGMLHIRDVEGPKKTGSVETRLEAMEQQVFKCQGMVEPGLNANHTMITEFTSNHKMDAIDIGKHLSRLYDRVDQLQGQIYDLKNQNCSRAFEVQVGIGETTVGLADTDTVTPLGVAEPSRRASGLPFLTPRRVPGEILGCSVVIGTFLLGGADGYRRFGVLELGGRLLVDAAVASLLFC